MLEPLVGVTAGAKLLGIPPSNFKRDAKPRLTEVPVEGSASVYFRSEVVALALERQLARNGRESAKDAQSAAPAPEGVRSSAQAKADVVPIPKS